MLSQTRYAVDKLKASGLKRSEFSCNVERHYFTDPVTGKRGYEWGDVSILVKCPTARIWEVLPAMLDQKLGITVYVFANGTYSTPFITDKHKEQGKLKIIHLGIKNSWGGNLVEIIK